MDGLHSPWGTLGKLKIERGCSHEYILWREAWINLLMESADQPRYVKRNTAPVVDGAEGLKQKLGR